QTVLVTVTPQASPSPTVDVSASPTAVAETETDESVKETPKETPKATPKETTAAPDPEPAETEDAPEVAVPTVSIYDQRCSSGKLIAVVKANYSNAYRKGIKKVVMERQNEYDAWLDYNANWMTADTGQGNQWTATINKLDGETLRITATSDDNTTTVISVPVTPAAC